MVVLDQVDLAVEAAAVVQVDQVDLAVAVDQVVKVEVKDMVVGMELKDLKVTLDQDLMAEDGII